MLLDHSSYGNIVVIEVGGRIDCASAERLGARLSREIEAGARYLVLDLQRVDSLGGDGLWEMFSALKRARQARGDIRLAQPSDPAREALAASRLDEIFRIFETPADAVASF